MWLLVLSMHPVWIWLVGAEVKLSSSMQYSASFCCPSFSSPESLVSSIVYLLGCFFAQSWLVHSVTAYDSDSGIEANTRRKHLASTKSLPLLFILQSPCSRWYSVPSEAQEVGVIAIYFHVISPRCPSGTWGTQLLLLHVTECCRESTAYNTLHSPSQLPLLQAKEFCFI